MCCSLSYFYSRCGSSAYLVSSIDGGMLLFMSDMNMMNSIGPSTLPCITPASTSSQSEYCLLDFTLCFLLVRYCAIHDVNQFGRSFSSLWSRMRWLIKSNAFLKSKKTACVVLPSSVALYQSSMTLVLVRPLCYVSVRTRIVCCLSRWFPCI